ncbi:MAG: hypothetical protein Kow0042_23240 [Calditrichia bacterium]
MERESILSYRNGMFLLLIGLILISSAYSYNWEILTVPSPVANGTFQDIVALSDTDIWTVGFFRDPGSTGKAGDVSFAMHFDGTNWQIFSLPQYGYSNDNLYSVTATSTNDVWAVGSFDDNLRRRFPLLLHWDGSNWSRVDLGNAAGNLYSIEAITGTDIWAVGEGSGPGAPGANITNLVIHYDGSGWQGVEIPSPGNRTNRLTDVNGSSSNDVWLVGYYRNSTGLYTSIIFHWDGNSWSVANNPNPPYQNFLYATISLSPDNMFAIGRNDAQAVIQHWDGSNWSLINIPGGSKFDMDYADANHIWATGYDIVSWDGSSMQQEYLTGVTNFNLRGVDVVNANSVWAAGGSNEYPYLVVHRTAGGPPPNIPPVAVASADVTYGHSPLTVNFSSAGSHDPDGSIVSYFWDFDDGTTSTDPIPTHTFSHNHSYLVRYYVKLTVTDDQGATDDAYVFVDVDYPAPPPTNQNPVAVATASVSSGPAPLTVNFSSAGSYDPDGTIVEYHWNFGDGNVSLNPNPTHTYSQAGSYPVVLTVKDDDGAYGSDLLQIEVTAPSTNPTVHVASQDVYREKVSSRRWRAKDLVLIEDENGNPVSGATVYASYSGPTSGQTHATTKSSGLATLKTKTYRGKNPPAEEWCFTVTDVAITGYDYDPSQNVVTTQCESGMFTESFGVENNLDTEAENGVKIFPNPFNPATTIQISLNTDEKVTIRLYDVTGRLVNSIANDHLYSAGTYSFRWDGKDTNGTSLPSGLYFLQVKIGSKLQIHKLHLIK